jgi:hypothetical protein
LVRQTQQRSVDHAGSKPLKVQLAVPQAVTRVDDSFAWEPRLALWYDVGSRVGLMVAARYMHTRPALTFADGSQHAWKADRFTIEAGLTFTLIQAPWARHTPGHP